MEAVAGASTGGAAPAEAVCANAEEVALPDEVDGDAHAPRASPPQHWPAQPRHLLVRAAPARVLRARCAARRLRASPARRS
jgi:hypothetical protein